VGATVGAGVFVGGTRVAVGGTTVAVGGIGVAVGGTGVLVGGTRVAVGGMAVAVGGTGVGVGGAAHATIKTSASIKTLARVRKRNMDSSFLKFEMELHHIKLWYTSAAFFPVPNDAVSLGFVQK
jgi:hypothetical protein